MPHKTLLTILYALLLTLPVFGKGKEKQDTAFQSLYQRYFRLYGEPDKEKEFYEASEQMKAYYQKAGKTNSYYKIRQNEVLYDAENGKTFRAIKRANEILDDMKKDGVRYYEIVYTALGTIYESRGNYRMANHYYMDALKNAEPTDSGALISIYSRLASLKAAREPQEAWEWNEKFGAMSADFPDYYKVYLALKGEICFYLGRKGDFQRADAEFQQYVKSRPELDDYGVAMMQVLRLAMAGHYGQALAMTDQELAATTDIGRYDIRGRIYEMMGRYDQALQVSALRRDLRDSLNSDMLFDNINEVNAELGLVRLSERAAREREELNAKAVREREMWLVVTIVLLLVGFGLIVWRYLTRRAYQRQLVRQNRELEIALDRAQESDRMKTSFIEHVSHEIRTPLNVITGFAQIITNPDYELDAKDRDNMLRDISRNTVEITNIVNELLELAQDESKEFYEKEDKVDVNQLCQGVMDRMGVLNDGRLQLNYVNLLSDGYTVRSNTRALVKVLSQLMKNALKFTKQGSVELKVRERAAHGGLEFTVTDTGIGIAPEQRDRIFERFYKVDPFKQGLGLGLTMARKIAELLGGTLTLDATYQRGARFVFVLPE